MSESRESQNPDPEDSSVTNPTDNEKARQLELGITSESVTIYKYKTHVYQRLADALKFAEIDRLRTPEMDEQVE